MSLLEEIKKVRKLKGVSWEQLADNLPISGNGLRIAFTRESVDQNYLESICKYLEIDIKTDQNKEALSQNSDKPLNEDEVLFIINSIFTHENQLMTYNAFRTFIEDKEEKAKNKVLRELLKKRLGEIEDE